MHSKNMSHGITHYNHLTTTYMYCIYLMSYYIYLRAFESYSSSLLCILPPSLLCIPPAHFYFSTPLQDSFMLLGERVSADGSLDPPEPKGDWVCSQVR